MLAIPTIGIGAGPHCDGQVLVIHDLLGLMGDFRPKFVKQYTWIRPIILEAMQRYRQDVIDGRFPAAEHAFSMPEDALDALKRARESIDDD